MVAVTVHSVTIELWKETAFPLCRAIERRWKRNIVSLVSSVIVVMRLIFARSRITLFVHVNNFLG